MRLLAYGSRLTACAAFLFASPAPAADMQIRAAPAAGIDASGAYAGLFAGYGWGEGHATAPFDAVPAFFYNFGGVPYDFDANGVFAGALAGYEWRHGALVTGLEGEIGYLGLKGSRLDPNGIAEGFDDTRTSLKSDFYGALYARAGVAADNLLFYVKGGAAALRAKASTIDPCIAPPVGCGTQTLTMRGSRTLYGWSLGAGVEWAAAPGWSVKAEYAYFDFGTVRTAGFSNVDEFYTQRIDVTAHTAKLGIVYRFGAVPRSAWY